MNALAVSPAAANALAELEGQMARLKKTAANWKTELEERSDQLIFSGEILVSALITGWAQGRWGEHTIWGFRTDMLVGAGLVLLGLWTDSDWGDHIVNLGLGAVAVSGASWAARKGVGEHAAKTGAATPTTASGNAGSKGMRLTDDMLSRMATIG